MPSHFAAGLRGFGKTLFARVLLSNPKMVLEGIRYRVLATSAEVERYVLSITEKEWDAEDFEEFGRDLHDREWTLERVTVGKIKVLKHQLESAEFLADMTPRVEQQRVLHRSGEAIPPLILRGDDYLIFDGYARWHLLNELGVNECLAYVGRRRID